MPATASSGPPPQPPVPDNTSQNPTKQRSRQECWDSRDAFFQCCTEQNEDQTKCQAERSVFEAKCLPSWVRHFEIMRFGPELGGAGGGVRSKNAADVENKVGLAMDSKNYFQQSVPTGRRDEEKMAKVMNKS
ncbi:unnamed protein product [Amoebophrya sp. A120]|nr:unnamed protein product [Amoebophrya sp. A120]|eukprot:GSA120T00015884001.1